MHHAKASHSRRSFALFLSTAACANLLGAGANPQSVSTADGNGADAFITSTSPTTNFGLREDVAIKHDSCTGQLHRKGYFRFDVSSLPAAGGEACIEFVYAFGSVNSPPSSDFDIFGLADGHSGESWDELSINWSNAPAMSSSGGSDPQGCGGSFSTVVNDGDVIPSGLDAGSGNSGWYQYWYRDPDNGPGNLGTALSDAIQLDFL